MAVVEKSGQGMAGKWWVVVGKCGRVAVEMVAGVGMGFGVGMIGQVERGVKSYQMETQPGLAVKD